MTSQSIVSLQINSYERIYDEVLTISDKQVFDTWFQVDVTPFKQALLNIVKRWSFMFKQHLIDHVTNRCAPCFRFPAERLYLNQ